MDDSPEPIDAETRQELLEVIDEESDRLNRFIEGMVELARIEAGEMNLRRNWDSIEEIIAAAESRAARLTADHRVEVRLDPELPAIRVDARAVTEVIFTLLDNARKYAPAGSVITISAARAAGDMIEIAVTDQGPGIPPTEREHVFNKFFRVDDAADVGPNESAGLGLGLAIARGIIEAHGGRIFAAAGPGGVGARVAFVLPTGDDSPELSLRLCVPFAALREKARQPTRTVIERSIFTQSREEPESRKVLID